MARELKRGDILRADWLNTLQRDVRQSAILGGAIGVRSTTAGRIIDVPSRPSIPVFLIRETEDKHLIGKQAFRFPEPEEPEEPEDPRPRGRRVRGGKNGNGDGNGDDNGDDEVESPVWNVFAPMEDRFLIRGEPWPGYTVADFEQYFIADPTKVKAGEIAVEFIRSGFSDPTSRAGGFFLPLAAPSDQPIPVYIVGLAEPDNLKVRPVILGESGQPSIDPNGPLIEAPPMWGYNLNHFAFDVIDDFPQPEDRVALLINGRVLPDRRMMLVEPASVEDFCQPCEGESATATIGLPRSTIPVPHVRRFRRALHRPFTGDDGGCVGCGGGSP